MPEILNEDAVRTANAQPQFNYGLGSAPTGSFDIPDQYPPAEESIFHPVKAFEDVIAAINNLASQVSLLVKDIQRERTFTDRPALLGGSAIVYTADYLERKYLYMLAPSAITLVPSTGGTIGPLVANKWQNISLPRGTTFTNQGGSDATPIVVQIRACDMFLG